MRFPSRLKFRMGQINGLRSFIEKTKDKSEYRRAVAVLQNSTPDLSTCRFIAICHYLAKVFILSVRI
jgi:hypothetical protein